MLSRSSEQNFFLNFLFPARLPNATDASNASCAMQAILCRTVCPSTAVCSCLAIALCCVYMVIQVLETFVMVKCTTQCTQGNINCLPTCDVQAYITHGADEPSA